MLLSQQSFAKSTIDTCYKSEEATTEIISSCLDKVVNVTDRNLQTWINLHQFNLEEKALINGRQSALKMFKRSQSNFTTYRENNCRWQYLTVSPNVTAGLTYKECYILLSQQRIDELMRLADLAK